MSLRACVLGLCLAGWVGAVEPKPQTTAANKAQREWAEKIAAGLRIRLEKVAGLKHPASAEVVEERPTWTVKFQRLQVVRRRFPTPERAREHLWAEGARICPDDPRWITEVQGLGDAGRDENMRVIARTDEVWPLGEPAPADLGARIGMDLGPEVRRWEDAGRTVVTPALPGFEGERAEMSGLTVERRRCADAGTADKLFGYHTDAVADYRTIGDLRGAELLIVRGPWIDDPRAAASVIDLAWKSGAEPAGRDAVGVLSPARNGTIDELSGVTLHAGGCLYGAGANVIKAAREKGGDQSLEGSVRWKFQDPGVRNHVIVRTKDTMWAEARVTAASMFVVLGKNEPGWKREKEYLMALLAGLRVELPEASPGFVELVEPGK